MTPLVELSELMVSRGGSVDPSRFPDELFDLYSIPSFDLGASTIVAGADIGSVKQIVRPGDVLLSKIVPHIRRAWVVDGRRGHRIVASGEWIVFRNPDVDSNYLRHLLISDWFHAHFMATVSGVGGSLLRARPAFVSKIRVPLPATDEQRRIADILDRADALRAKRREVLAHLHDLTRSIFLDMFGDPRQSGSSNVLSLTDLCQPYSGGTPSKLKPEYWNGSVPWFSPKDLKVAVLSDSQDHIASVVPQTTNLRLLPRNTVAMVVRGMILAHTAPVSMLTVPATINQDLKAFLPRERVNPYFLLWSIRVQHEAILASVSTAAHGTKKLDADALSSIIIPRPGFDMEKRFGERAVQVRRQLQMSNLGGTNLNGMFHSLQQRAFAGQL